MPFEYESVKKFSMFSSLVFKGKSQFLHCPNLKKIIFRRL